MKRIFGLAAVLCLLITSPAFADSLGSAVGGTAGNQSNMGGGLCLSSPSALTNGQQAGLVIDCITHALIVGGSSSTPDFVSPAPRTIVALDVATVTTGGTAVTALTAGHKTAGGFLVNPKGATIDLCINEQAAASGTTSAGGLVCILPGQAYTLTPSTGSVSVITSDSSHPFAGYGLN